MDKCCGLDGFKDSIFACILDAQGKKNLEKRYGTLIPELDRLRETLVEHYCVRLVHGHTKTVMAYRLLVLLQMEIWTHSAKPPTWWVGQGYVRETTNRQARYSRTKHCMVTNICGRYSWKLRGQPSVQTGRFGQKAQDVIQADEIAEGATGYYP